MGLTVGKRFPVSEFWAYIVAQVAGGIAAAAVLYTIASGKGWVLARAHCRLRHGGYCIPHRRRGTGAGENRGGALRGRPVNYSTR